MPVKIEASEKPLLKVFSTDFDFHLPFYQRPYAWTTVTVQPLYRLSSERAG